MAAKAIFYQVALSPPTGWAAGVRTATGLDLAPLRRLTSAFSLVEVIVAIAIIGSVLAVSLSAVQSSREAARSNECRTHLRQVIFGLQQYEQAFRQVPPSNFRRRIEEGPNSRAWSWIARILPQIGEGTIYQTGQVPRKTLRESGVASTQLAVLLCPTDPFSQRGPRRGAGNLPNNILEEGPFLAGQTNYKGVCGAAWGADSSLGLDDIGTHWPHVGANGSRDGQDHGDGILLRSNALRPRRFRDVVDGASHTFAIGEALPELDFWCSWPYANNAHSTCAIPPNFWPQRATDRDSSYWPNNLGFRSLHPGGLNFARLDGSVEFVDQEIDHKLYRGMATIAGRD